ncbi:MAG: class I SAM-dependent methyltransferase [bacterium]
MNYNKDFERSDVTQESQYGFPYHYIPSFDNGHFCQHIYWRWGLSYVAGLELILSTLAEKDFESLLDVGCGDGRFIREVNDRFPGKKLLGVDSSAQAINLAQAMNPSLSYACINIDTKQAGKENFDVVTLIEVLEHIPIDSVTDFVTAFAATQKPNGRLVLTVPHKNNPIQVKHFQHFDTVTLKMVLEHHYDIERMVFFDKRGGVFRRIVGNLIGNRFFILNNRRLLNFIYKIYKRHLLICKESECRRILVVGRRR